MTITRTPKSDTRHAFSHVLSQVLEGPTLWGTLELPDPLSMGRMGWGHYRLSIYPPGTNDSQRRALTFRRRWPWVGIVVGILVAVATTSDWGFLLGAAVYAAGFLVAAHLTSAIRPQIRKLHVAVAVAGGAREVFGDAEQFTRTSAALAELDRALDEGEITPAQYEFGWAAVYESIP